MIYLGVIAAYGWWAVRITEEGERPPFSKAPLLSKDEFAAAEASEEQAARNVSRESSKALSKVLRK